MEIILLLVIVAVFIAAYVQNQRENKVALENRLKAMQAETQKNDGHVMEQKNEREQNEKMEQWKTKELFLEILKKIGCQYEIL